MAIAVEAETGVERLERFAVVGLCPQCRKDLGEATLSENGLVCPACSYALQARAGVVLALAAEPSVDDRPRAAPAQAPPQGWAAGIRADMDGKAATYAAKYERLTRTSSGFLVRRELALGLAGDNPGRVLEAGCGPGVVSPLLAERGIDTHGMDLSAGQLRTAAARDPHTLHVQGDLMRLPYRTGTFDTVILIGVLEYVEQPESVMQEIARVLAPSGRLIVSVPNVLSPVRLWTEHGYLPLSRLAKRLLGRPVGSYSRRLYTAAGLAKLVEGAGLYVETSRFFDVVLAGPPLDRLLGERPPRVAARLERQLRGPLRSLASGQILMRTTKAGPPAARAAGRSEAGA